MSIYNLKFKVIYSLKIHLILKKKGFKCLEEMKNPANPRFLCWVYEATPELLEEFDRCVREGSNG